MTLSSRKAFVYVTDLGDLFAITRDESNMENALTGNASDLSAADVASVNYYLPSNVEPRSANYTSTTTSRVKTIALPRPADYLAALTGDESRVLRSFVDTDTGETFRFTGAINEQFKPVVFSIDTGLNDGDAE